MLIDGVLIVLGGGHGHGDQREEHEPEEKTSLEIDGGNKYKFDG